MVMDFGIAKAVTAAGQRQSDPDRHVVGTPGLREPGAGRGRGGTRWPKRSVYSLGCMVYEMLVRLGAVHRLYRSGRHHQALHRGCPLRSAPLVPTSPKRWTRAVPRSLARVPAERYATAAQFGQALAIHGSLLPVTSRPTVVPQPVAAAKSVAVLPFADMSSDGTRNTSPTAWPRRSSTR